MKQRILIGNRKANYSAKQSAADAQYGALSTVDGLAVGSASLSPEKFAAIAQVLATCN